MKHVVRHGSIHGAGGERVQDLDDMRMLDDTMMSLSNTGFFSARLCVLILHFLFLLLISGRC